MEQALWFFGLVSPFSYLHRRKLASLCERLEIRAVPILFAELLKNREPGACRSSTGAPALLSEAQSGGWSTTWRHRCIEAIAMLYACADLDPRDAHARILVAGSPFFASDVIRKSESHGQAAQAILHNRWQRDRSIFSLGKEARHLRVIGFWVRTARRPAAQHGKGV